MCTQPVEYLPCCQGVLCASWKVFVSTLASRGSSRSLHNSMRAAFAVVLMGSVYLIKLFRDFRRGTTPRCPLSGCLSSVVCRVRSVQLATALLKSDGAIPASMGRLLVFVGFRQPVIIRQVSFSVAFSLFAWVERSHTGKHTLQLSSSVIAICFFSLRLPRRNHGSPAECESCTSGGSPVSCCRPSQAISED